MAHDHSTDLRHLGDFDVSPRLLAITAFAVPIGALSAGVAWCLLRLIGLITNLVFYQRFGTALVAPGEIHHTPLLILLAPICGGLVIGLVARFGSEKIRGHGIPEAIESILTGGSKVEPRVALLKPLASAIAIGTGGPFGAEGPIIMTGGAFGSIFAQLLHLSADERKTLLVSGAAAGMAATFDAPLASLLLAVELLLFEWRPRSFIPVAAAVAVATVVRVPLLGSGPIFPVPTSGLHLDAASYALCIVSGVLAGLLALIATSLVYLSEDTFTRLPIHWMWWPAIGGLIIGLGGLVVPQALGVGYDVIEAELNGTIALHLIIGILIVKTLIWSLSLGSGTSGGVLAPMLMIGGALGGLEAQIFPAVGAGFWPLVGLAGVLGGVMRSPLTGVVFALELTHRYEALLPLLIGATTAYAISVLILRRSVLTEKVARRGIHLTREYNVDPLEVLFVGDVMSDIETAATNGARAALNEAEARLNAEPGDLDDAPIVFADDTLRHVAYVMAESGRTELAVAERARPEVPVGTVRLEQLLAGRLRDLDEDRHRSRVLRPLELLGVGRA
ncbi:MAG TPA: chloride channel protein [Solirubrobacterales bacterium]|nr:chloride channel protein [Solirubrobacterales bacterium]